MKKTLVSLVLLGGIMSAMADWDIQGQITAINPSTHTITLNGNTLVQILPYTELKGDDCSMWGNDIYGTFNDLTIGKFVEAEVYPSNPPHQAQNNMQGLVAKEVEWKCGRMAY